MRYLWLGAGGLSLKRERDAPQGGESEVLVRVRLAGICGTDLELVKGYYGSRGVLRGHLSGNALPRAVNRPRRGQDEGQKRLP